MCAAVILSLCMFSLIKERKPTLASAAQLFGASPHEPKGNG